jgi:hypothetical protein
VVRVAPVDKDITQRYTENLRYPGQSTDTSHTIIEWSVIEHSIVEQSIL